MGHMETGVQITANHRYQVYIHSNVFFTFDCCSKCSEITVNLKYSIWILYKLFDCLVPIYLGLAIPTRPCCFKIHICSKALALAVLLFVSIPRCWPQKLTRVMLLRPLGSLNYYLFYKGHLRETIFLILVVWSKKLEKAIWFRRSC